MPRPGTRPTAGFDAAIKALHIRRPVSDSRQVRPRDTFIAYPGEARDGRDFIAQAIAAGTASVLWEAHDFQWDPEWRVPNVGVRDLRRRAGEIASHRSEDPDGITAEIVRGTTRACEIAPDRAAPIRLAIHGVRRNDIVLLAGKGHEQYQSIRGVNHPFSDAAVARDVLRELQP
jgi:UDP-N-acetylmuramyl tripeptide synthase